jgi:bifunctional pyridoxal-dependent enzyme with beta-cystathionase and maltose regulon repressor activities
VPLAATADGWALDLDAMQAASKDRAHVHLLCSPHNPTGIVHRRHDSSGWRRWPPATVQGLGIVRA